MVYSLTLAHDHGAVPSDSLRAAQQHTLKSTVFYPDLVSNTNWRCVMQYRIILPVLNQNFYFLAEAKSGNIVRVVPC